MEEAAKNESTIRQNAGNEVSGGLQHIYSNLAKARQAGEDEYGPKNDTIEEFEETNAENQSGLGDNTGNEGGVSVPAAKHSPSLQPTRTLPRTKRDRREALKQQGLGRRRRDKENKAAPGSGQDTDTESESENIKNAKPKKKAKDVLTRMEAVTGPLSLLHKSVSERLKVKVWIRSANCIRGICTGYILAFDTHFNMVMADVDEVYKPAGNPNPTKKVRKKRKKRVIKPKSMEDIDKDEEEPTIETAMEMSETASGELRADCQLDGAADSSDSESDVNSATTAHSGDSDHESSSQKLAQKNTEEGHSEEENDSTEGAAEEESDASSESEEDVEELMARLEKLKHEYENLKTGETPIKQSPNDNLSPSKEGVGAATVVKTTTEEATGRRRSQRLRSQPKPLEVGTIQAEMKTTSSTKRHTRDRGKSSSSTMDSGSKTASSSRDKLERGTERHGHASRDKQSSAGEKYESQSRKHDKTGSSNIHSTVKHSDEMYPEESSSYREESEDTRNPARVDRQKSARLESMIANLKVDEHEESTEADTPSTDLRTKLRLIRESKAQKSKTQITESDKTPSRKIRSQVVVLEEKRKDFSSNESDSDSDEERGDRKWHSERGRDDRYRKRSPPRDIHREPRKGDSKERERHRDSDKEREYERRREHEKRKESERLKAYEELDRQKKREQCRGNERAREHERKKEYDRLKESERHSYREHDGDKDYKRQKEYERQRAHERQKDQERGHASKREERRGEGHQREQEKSKSSESYKDYDKYKESEGYSMKHKHIDQETHRTAYMGDDKRATISKDDPHKSPRTGKGFTRSEENKTSGKGDYYKEPEHKSEGDKGSLSKYTHGYNAAITSKPAYKSELLKSALLPGGHVTPYTGGRTMKPSFLEQLRGSPLGDAGLYQRHVKQMMIRGDNVVMVSIVP